MEILVWLLMALVLIPVCHGIWVGLAKLFRALSGEFGDPNDHAFGRLYGQACRFCGESMRPFEDRCPRCGLARAAAREASDLRATSRHLREFLAKSFAKWQLPDAFVFLPEIPRTSVGKFKKIALREQFANWNWEPHV